jgi:acetyl-CoA carboxylase biotin carboxyl carrier protein
MTATTAAAPSAANSGAARVDAPGTAATHAASARATASDPNLHDVPSPLLGTFYRSPKPGAPPFVEVGSAVTEESIVAIIEVMKLMNTVRAGVRGTVAEILPSDGSLVEYDQPILRIRKSG